MTAMWLRRHIGTVQQPSRQLPLAGLVAWTIDEFVLVRSVQGRGKHVIVGHWRLAEG